MLHVGLDLSRKRLDFHALDRDGVRVETGAVAPDVDGLAEGQRARAACLQDRPHRRLGVGRVLASRARTGDLWLPDPEIRAERERARFRIHLVRHRSAFKQRVHATRKAEASDPGIRSLSSSACCV
jgi:transposase